jgi:hypothetical protein
MSRFERLHLLLQRRQRACRAAARAVRAAAARVVRVVNGVVVLVVVALHLQTLCDALGLLVGVTVTTAACEVPARQLGLEPRVKCGVRCRDLHGHFWLLLPPMNVSAKHTSKGGVCVVCVLASMTA